MGWSSEEKRTRQDPIIFKNVLRAWLSLSTITYCPYKTVGLWGALDKSINAKCHMYCSWSQSAETCPTSLWKGKPTGGNYWSAASTVCGYKSVQSVDFPCIFLCLNTFLYPLIYCSILHTSGFCHLSCLRPFEITQKVKSRPPPQQKSQNFHKIWALEAKNDFTFSACLILWFWR